MFLDKNTRDELAIATLTAFIQGKITYLDCEACLFKLGFSAFEAFDLIELAQKSKEIS